MVRLDELISWLKFSQLSNLRKGEEVQYDGVSRPVFKFYIDNNTVIEKIVVFGTEQMERMFRKIYGLTKDGEFLFKENADFNGFLKRFHEDVGSKQFLLKLACIDLEVLSASVDVKKELAMPGESNLSQTNKVVAALLEDTRQTPFKFFSVIKRQLLSVFSSFRRRFFGN